MKSKRKWLCTLLVFALCFLLSVPASAAVKINRKSATLIKGQSVQLKISGTKKKVKWSSSKKSVATVSSKGMVKAVKNGTAKITAKVGSKKYTCKITVREKKIACVPSKPIVFAMSGQKKIRLNSFSVKCVQYKPFSNYDQEITDRTYFFPYRYNIKVSGSVVNGKKGEQVILYFGLERNGVITNLSNNLRIEATVKGDGTFANEEIIPLPNMVDCLYITSGIVLRANTSR
ncbi:MAG: Ig-like domain-containing protein [Eubacteriales bacterium]|nr:Ig-like domain-containing protein [Eubacteriales bacterium]